MPTKLTSEEANTVLYCLDTNCRTVCSWCRDF